jgi:hypothetical protein
MSFRHRRILFQKVSWRIVGGMAIATPVVAVAQGAFLLYGMSSNGSRSPAAPAVSHDAAVTEPTKQLTAALKYI